MACRDSSRPCGGFRPVLGRAPPAERRVGDGRSSGPGHDL